MTSTRQTDVIYSDLMMDFDMHPVKKDLVRSVNEASVKRSIRNLIMTSKGERLFNGQLGSNVRQYLFEPMTPHVQFDLQRAIEQTINNYEPRARLINVVVTPDYANNAYNVKVLFYIINRTDPITLAITLERLR